MRHTKRSPSPAAAALYCRVSTQEQVQEGVSLAAQEARGRAYCEAAGLALGPIFRDEGVSASKALRTRPAGKALLDAIERGEVGAVVVVKLDRLFRNAGDCLTTADTWVQHGVALHLIDHGGQSLNTAGASGKLMLTILAGFAEMERTLIAERTSAAMRHMADTGQRLGPSPLGFATPAPGAPLTPNPDELKVVRLILSERERGQTYRAIAERLTADGVPTKRGGHWQPMTVRRVCERRAQYVPLLDECDPA